MSSPTPPSRGQDPGIVQADAPMLPPPSPRDRSSGDTRDRPLRNKVSGSSTASRSTAPVSTPQLSSYFLRSAARREGSGHGPSVADRGVAIVESGPSSPGDTFRSRTRYTDQYTEAQFEDIIEECRNMLLANEPVVKYGLIAIMTQILRARRHPVDEPTIEVRPETNLRILHTAGGKPFDDNAIHTTLKAMYLLLNPEASTSEHQINFADVAICFASCVPEYVELPSHLSRSSPSSRLNHQATSTTPSDGIVSSSSSVSRKRKRSSQAVAAGEKYFAGAALVSEVKVNFPFKTFCQLLCYLLQAAEMSGCRRALCVYRHLFSRMVLASDRDVVLETNLEPLWGLAIPISELPTQGLTGAKLYAHSLRKNKKNIVAVDVDETSARLMSDFINDAIRSVIDLPTATRPFWQDLWHASASAINSVLTQMKKLAPLTLASHPVGSLPPPGLSKEYSFVVAGARPKLLSVFKSRFPNHGTLPVDDDDQGEDGNIEVQSTGDGGDDDPGGGSGAAAVGVSAADSGHEVTAATNRTGSPLPLPHQTDDNEESDRDGGGEGGSGGSGAGTFERGREGRDESGGSWPAGDDVNVTGGNAGSGGDRGTRTGRRDHQARENIVGLTAERMVDDVRLGTKRDGAGAGAEQSDRTGEEYGLNDIDHDREDLPNANEEEGVKEGADQNKDDEDEDEDDDEDEDEDEAREPPSIVNPFFQTLLRHGLTIRFVSPKTMTDLSHSASVAARDYSRGLQRPRPTWKQSQARTGHGLGQELSWRIRNDEDAVHIVRENEPGASPLGLWSPGM